MRCHPGPSFISIFYKHIRLSIAQLQVCIKVGISLSPKDITLGLMETKRWRFILCNNQRHYGWCLLNLECRKTRRLRLRRDRRYISIEHIMKALTHGTVQSLSTRRTVPHSRSNSAVNFSPNHCFSPDYARFCHANCCQKLARFTQHIYDVHHHKIFIWIHRYTVSRRRKSLST
jgi:hypothetical protein